MKVSVIIPTLGENPDTLLVGEALKGLDFEIIVEIDWQGEGKGVTLQRGFKKAKGERIVWLDADMQIHPKHIRAYLAMTADIIIASKLHPWSNVHYPLRRKVINWFAYIITKLLFNLPIRDTQTGLKIFNRKVLEDKWCVKGFGHDIEVLTRAYEKDYTMIEMPIVVEKPVTSSVTLYACWRTFYEMLWVKYQLLFRPTREEI